MKLPSQDIEENGLWSPLTTCVDSNGDEVLLDGRNRPAACEIAAVKPIFELYVGDDPVGFVVSQNVTRRHLSESQRAMVAAELANLKRGSNQFKPLVGSVEPPISQARAAKMVDVSVPSVKRAVTVLREAEPELINDVKIGKKSVSGVERIIRGRETEKVTAEPFTAAVDIRQGDFLDVFADLTDADAIITKLPYQKKFLPLIDHLEAWASRVLASNGVLVVMTSVEFLPEVFVRLGGHYRSIVPLIPKARPVFSQQQNVTSAWKPLVVYGGSKRFCDGPIGPGTDLEVFTEVVERLTLPGQTVVDPFMDTGTIPLAAHRKGRHAIGCDLNLNANAVAEARRRFVGSVAKQRTA